MKVLEVSTLGFGDPRYYRSNELVLCKTLAKFGHDVTLFSSNRHPKWQMLEERRVEREVEVMDGFSLRRFPSGPELGTVPVTPSLFKEILEFDYDILHVHCTIAPASFYSALASRMKSKPMVLTQQDYAFGDAHGPKLFAHMMSTYTLGRFVTHTASAVIGLSTQAARLAESFGAAPIKTRVIPASVDSTLFRPDQRNLLRERWGMERPVVLLVGRLTKHKSVDTLLHAFNEVVSTVPDAKLVIIGKGPDELHLRALQKHLRLDGKVFFLGGAPPGQMQYIYPGADLLVLPSIYEPFGNVVLEAMASGLPVIGSNIGGMADIISDSETGFHIKPRDTAQLANRLRQLLVNSRTRSSMSKAARKAAVSKFDDLVVTRSVERLYYECLNN